ncbi:MAG: GNAT family N-acetyltransferase [Bacillaceae bacterium]|nr:GNAT family N-acetyltransferase [Bacillaceae bacterium]
MFTFEYIDERHREKIESFDCDDEPLVQNFLREDALRFHQYNTAITRLYFNENQELIGFFTLYNDQIEIVKSKRQQQAWELPTDIKFYPSIKLHFLGVDKRFRKLGYGEYLLFEVIEISKKIAKDSGCNFISLEALNSSIRFYEKYGFVRVKRMGKDLTVMVLKVDEFM